LVDRALRLATAEVAEASQYAEAKARQTIALAWLALALFVVVGTTSGIRLSGSVRKVAQDFEDAAAKVGEQRDRLRTVMTAMHDALVVIDARGGISMANDAACALLGYGETELIGSPVGRYVEAGSTALPDAAELSEYLGHVRQSSEALLAIINEVLDLSKIEAGRLRLDPAPFSLRRALGAVLSGMAIRADEKKLELAVDVRAHVPDAVVGDVS